MNWGFECHMAYGPILSFLFEQSFLRHFLHFSWLLDHTKTVLLLTYCFLSQPDIFGQDATKMIIGHFRFHIIVCRFSSWAFKYFDVFDLELTLVNLHKIFFTIFKLLKFTFYSVRFCGLYL